MGNSLNIRRHYPIQIQLWISEQPPTIPQFNVEAQVKTAAGHNANTTLDWRVQIQVTFVGKEGDTEVARGSVDYVGFFDIPEAIPEDKRGLYIIQQGGSILYGATRELVANFSSRSPHRLITLPPATFVNAKLEKPPEETIHSATV